MNAKLVFMVLMISSMLAISVSGRGQKTMDEVILQDDKSSDHLIFVISTGEYKFESCKGNFSTQGVGSVSVTGCKVVLKDISNTTRVLAEVDLCDGTGRADIVFEDDRLARITTSPLEFVVSDTNTKDSTFGASQKCPMGTRCWDAS